MTIPIIENKLSVLLNTNKAINTPINDNGKEVIIATGYKKLLKRRKKKFNKM